MDNNAIDKDESIRLIRSLGLRDALFPVVGNKLHASIRCGLFYLGHSVPLGEKLVGDVGLEPTTERL